MTSLLFRWLLNTVALVIVVNLVPGFTVASLPALLISSLVLGLLNAIVRPLLFWLTLPLTIVTLGLFLIVLNALMLELTDWIVDGFSISSFWSAIVGAIVLSLISLVANRIGGEENKGKRRKKG